MCTRRVVVGCSRVALALCAVVALAIAVGVSARVSAESEPAAAADIRSPRFVPDADWVAYFDVHGLTHSTLGKFIIEHSDELDLDINDLRQVKERFGIDPLTDIRDISMSGSGDPQQGQFAMVAQTTPAIDELFAQITGTGEGEGDADNHAPAEGMPQVQSLQIEGQQVYVASDGDEQTFFHVRQGPTSADRLVVVSMNKDWMARGLRAAGGMARDEQAALKPADGASIFVSVADLGWLDIDKDDQPASAIARNARGVTLNFGERGENTFLDLRVITASPDDAQNMNDIAQGLLAMGRLAARNQPEMKPLVAPLRSLTLSSDGPAVSLKFMHNTSGLIDILKGVADSGVFGAAIHADEEAGTIEVGAHVKTGEKPAKDGPPHNDNH